MTVLCKRSEHAHKFSIQNSKTHFVHHDIYAVYNSKKYISVKYKQAILFLSYVHCQNVSHDVVGKEKG